MHTADFDYQLPAHLIAQRPLLHRSASRLLQLDGGSGQIDDLGFADILRLVNPGDVLVLNNTRVIAARLHGRKRSGGRIELMIERVTDSFNLIALAKFSRALRPGTEILIEADGDVINAAVVARDGEFFHVRFEDRSVDEVLDRFGHVPLPPYIQRSDETGDRHRYQTVYATESGAVAAPTAGLHFDQGLLQQLRGQDVDIVFLTLHVGAGTFQPLRSDDITRHKLHSEWVCVPQKVCAAVQRARSMGNRVIAVGTTSARALETAAHDRPFGPYTGETDLFLYPGCRFNVVDAMITNFHLPKSTLLMMVCAFAGTGNTLTAYAHAVGAGYRFYSYGDAMFVTAANGTGRC